MVILTLLNGNWISSKKDVAAAATAKETCVLKRTVRAALGFDTGAACAIKIQVTRSVCTLGGEIF